MQHPYLPWLLSGLAPEAQRTRQQSEVLAISDTLIQELASADKYVIGVAMYNFSIPAVLKLWIDEVVRAGKTFSYEGGTPVGLLQNKKATVLVASGGVYEQGTPAAAMNFVEPYLRSILGFMGVTDTLFINAGRTIQISQGINREVVLGPAVQSIRSQFVQSAA